ncbi:ADP-ribosylglycohydrolase family protein [Albimonas pacifica]|uniref:ADP-ribosylglycohydrolase n=1 Tax=Albimonas pacifica TaxID=1114924 RepID=A0A1I3BTB5_9RHOB|nr:ADP-ribosylglycohydrolase family protein [Albimonas pacifica]SFH65544.1 ADP-ribosylglycohydrolase [Albimonas pacifica]
MHARNERRDRAEAALLGALVADAAALGLHWLYDPVRIASLQGPIVFRTPDAADFEGAAGVFVHAGKRAGELSHYGAALRTALQAVGAKGGDLAEAQARFAAAFGAGGWWVGYIDKPTRGTLANLAAGRLDPSGVEDDQIPGFARLPALVCRPGGAADAVQLAAAVAMTSTGAAARDWALAGARILAAALIGASPAEAVAAGETGAPEAVAQGLARARAAGPDPVAFAGEVGRACPMSMSVPVSAHILLHARSFAEAAEMNIRAGGDSCGRAILIGAVEGAIHGLGGAGVPAPWLMKLTDGATLAAEVAGVIGED